MAPTVSVVLVAALAIAASPMGAGAVSLTIDEHEMRPHGKDKIDHAGATELMYAIQKNDAAWTERLIIENHAHVNQLDGMKQSPVLFAVREHAKDALKVLVKHGASLDDANLEYSTPLLFAVSHGDADTVSILVDGGADTNKADKLGRTPLWLAVHANKSDCVEALLKSSKTDLDKSGGDGRAPLIEASKKNLVSLSRTLIKHGASPKVVDKGGRTPLYWAAWKASDDVVGTLLANGAKADTSEDNGMTPLMTAASFGNEACVKALLKAGADATMKNRDGSTALQLAEKSYLSTEVVRVALKEALGINPDARPMADALAAQPQDYIIDVA